MTPSAVPRVKAALRAVRADEAREVALHCLSLGTEAEIEAFARQALAPCLAPADS